MHLLIGKPAVTIDVDHSNRLYAVFDPEDEPRLVILVAQPQGRCANRLRAGLRSTTIQALAGPDVGPLRCPQANAYAVQG